MMNNWIYNPARVIVLLTFQTSFLFLNFFRSYSHTLALFCSFWHCSVKTWYLQPGKTRSFRNSLKLVVLCLVEILLNSSPILDELVIYYKANEQSSEFTECSMTVEQSEEFLNEFSTTIAEKFIYMKSNQRMKILVLMCVRVWKLENWKLQSTTEGHKILCRVRMKMKLMLYSTLDYKGSVSFTAYCYLLHQVCVSHDQD